MNIRRRPVRGFSLIELMVTVAIAAILMMVAAPNLVTFKRNSDLTAAANALLASINAARGEAMKRGQNAMVVPTNNGTDWNTGWVVFVHKLSGAASTWAYDAANDVTVQQQEAMPSYITVTGIGSATAGNSTPFLMFDSSGFNKDKGGNFVASVVSIARNDVPSALTSKETRLIIISRSGRARVCTPTSATDANCNSGLPQ